MLMPYPCNRCAAVTPVIQTPDNPEGERVRRVHSGAERQTTLGHTVVTASQASPEANVPGRYFQLKRE